MKLGFIGFGSMGTAIAERLLSEGYEIAGWNRTPSKMDGLDIQQMETPAEVVKAADITVFNLFDSIAVMEVLADAVEDGAEGKIILDTTTNHYDIVDDFYDICAVTGAEYVEAPVMGSVVPAKAGKLSIAVNCSDDAYAKVKNILETMGQNIYRIHGEGKPSKMKVVNNMLLGTFMTSIAEAVAIGEAAGIEKEMVIDVLSNGGGNSLVMNAKKQKLLDEDFSVHFAAQTLFKDMQYLMDLAYDLKIPLSTAANAKEIFARTFQQGLEEEDFSVVYKMAKGD